MKTKFLPLMMAIAAVLATSGPAMAQHGGGGHGGGGGGHAAGGGHAYAGGHAAGGGHAYAASYGGHAYSGGAHSLASSTHFAPSYHGAVAGVHGAYGYGGYGRGGFSSGAYWRGGYWRGGYWPRAYYGLGFAWFLPILPLAYATYWWDGIPYYYANDVYYTWSPAYEGYVATDPPPVADSAAGAAAASPEGQGPVGVGAQIFMYPKNGQSAEQQSTDRRECQDWAAHQAGTDGSRGDDYRRAMLACVEGRGYSAK